MKKQFYKPIGLIKLACSCLLIVSRLQAQQVFEDIVYEPSVIAFEGVKNTTINAIAERAFNNIKNYHSKTAQEGFDSILVMDKHNVLGAYGLAFCKFADGDYENSIELLNPLINVNLKNGFLYSLRGRSYMALDNLENAAENFKKAKEYGANELDYLSLSQCLFYMGDFNNSILEADNFITKQALKPDGFIVKGLAKAGLKEYDAALAEMEKAIELNSKNSFTHYQTARICVEMKDFNKAVKSINKAIKLDAENSEVVQLRAEIKYELHDYTNAIFDCNKVLELGDSSANTYLIRGKSNLKIGLKKEACVDFKKALTMGNKEVESLIAKSCN